MRATARKRPEIVLFASASRLHFSVSVGQARRGGRKGSSGGIPPAEPVNEICSDIFKYTPPSSAVADFGGQCPPKKFAKED
ncbi:hypothetical protein COT03_00430 [Candidatus Shapirobacteria bacterium CG07_land_8_20_14_0_80_39_18]|uniref:Uncharacterized protein n=1 Tax=Candidatus Shapirobacteria bacterium CG07_land_8_20_14_0_80_39_18 TaxID=1974882 RepID=A0A2M6YRZ1_9BACT|nr:MAG: hypothetical protein COT03_00430 [Candidatus Shapirobacteria bacterium CG07_land_8_20_14_0_80_39_18]